jgi:hypothetical protein
MKFTKRKWIVLLITLVFFTRSASGEEENSTGVTEDGVSQTDAAGMDSPPEFFELSTQPSYSDQRFFFYNQITGTERNLFGGGELLSANVGLNQSASGGNLSDLQAEVRYVQPVLFGDENYFLTGGVVAGSYNAVAGAGTNDSKYSAVYAHVGRRLFKRSHVTLGYEQILSGGYSGPNVASVGASPFGDKPGTGYLILSFGWNSFDSEIFPKEGSILNFYFGVNPFVEGSLMGGLQYRKYFSLGGDSVLILNFGGPADFAGNPVFSSLAAQGLFSYPLAIGFAQDFSRHVRFITEAGLHTLGIGTIHDMGGGPGINAGVSVEVPSFGIINVRVGYEITGVTS